MMGSGKKYIYVVTFISIGILLGCSILNFRFAILGVLLGVLFIVDYLTKKMKNVDSVYVFLFLSLFSFDRICIAITQPDTLLLRYVNDYCNLSVLDLMVFLMFLRLLHLKTNYKKYDTCSVLLILLFGFNLLSLFQSTNISATVWTCVRYLKLWVVFQYFKYVFDFEKHGNSLFKGALFGIMPQFFISFFQLLKKDAIGLTFLGEVKTLSVRNVDGSTNFRPSGTFEHPANMAFFAMFIFTLCLYEKRLKRITRYFIMMCCLMLIALAGSRTIMVLTLLAILIWVKQNGKKKNNFILISLGVLGISTIVVFTSTFDGIKDLFFNSDWTEQIVNRTTHWALLMTYIVKKPILGYGANTYTDITYYAASIANTLNTRFYLSNPCHNIYLQLWFDLGIGGVLCYITILINGMMRYFKVYKNVYIDERPILTSCFVFVCVLSIYNFTGWAGLKDQTNYMLYMMLGLLNSVQLKNAEYQPIRFSRSNKALRNLS